MNDLLAPSTSTTYTPWPRCDAIIPLGLTGEDSQLCGASASCFCEHCGPRCQSCFDEFPCYENGGIHTEQSDAYYRPARYRIQHLDLGTAMCLVIDHITGGGQ